MNQFIRLPSSTLLNRDRIHTAHPFQEGTIKIWFSSIEGDWIQEKMSMADLEALLNPPSSPIVESVVNLDNLKPGKACCFTFCGQVKHGVIKDFQVDHVNKTPFSSIRMTSAGTDYNLLLNNETVYLGD